MLLSILDLRPSTPIHRLLTENTLTVLTTALALYLTYLLLTSYLSSPLASVPNAHWSAPFSSVWITHLRHSILENRTLLYLHRQLGPIIRLSPHEISVCAIEGGVKSVFGGGYEKGEWYSIFDNYCVVCTFSAQDGKSHGGTKRLVSHVYSKLALWKSEVLKAQSRKLVLGRLLPAINEAGEGGTDVLSLFYASSMDAITAYQFGIDKSSNFIQEEEERRHFLDDLYQPRKQYAFYGQELPRLTKWLKMLGIRLVPGWVDAANQEIEEWCRGMCDAVIASSPSWSTADQMAEGMPENTPVVAGALMRGIAKEEQKDGSVLAERIEKWKEGMVYSEMLDHLAAGHETSGITLSYICYHLSRDIDLQHRLRQELLTLDPQIRYTGKEPEEGKELPDPKQIDALPLLNAVMMETLRLNAAIPGSTPRMTPKDGCQLVGHYIPGGVRVSSAAWALHRNEQVFPDSENWDWTRWVKGGEEERRERERWFWAFSSGSRMCIGNNFAVLRKSES